jgi:hypothetical protein
MTRVTLLLHHVLEQLPKFPPSVGFFLWRTAYLITCKLQATS